MVSSRGNAHSPRGFLTPARASAPSLRPLAVPWVALHFGWRASFLITGFFQRDMDRVVVDPLSHTRCANWLDGCRGTCAGRLRPFAWWHLLRYRQTWGFMIGKFLTDPVWWFFLFWLPQYFNSRFKLDLSHIGPPLVIVYVISTFGSVFGGWLPRGYIRLGMSLKSARLAAMLTCACLVVPIVVAGSLESVWVCVGLLSHLPQRRTRAGRPISSPRRPICFPSRHVGTVVSFGQVAGALGGAIFQPVAGHILQFTHSFVPLFLYSGFCLSAGIVIAAHSGSRPAARAPGD